MIFIRMGSALKLFSLKIVSHYELVMELHNSTKQLSKDSWFSIMHPTVFNVVTNILRLHNIHKLTILNRIVFEHRLFIYGSSFQLFLLVLFCLTHLQKIEKFMLKKLVEFLFFLSTLFVYFQMIEIISSFFNNIIFFICMFYLLVKENKTV